MKDVRSFVAILLALLMAAPAGFAQQAPTAEKPQVRPALESTEVPEKPQVPTPPITNWYSKYTQPYRQPTVAEIRLANSNRIESLLRAGKIYLSLEDAIALALENNLDIEMSRYGPQAAHADYLRAKAGGLLRGVPATVTQGPSSAISQAGISANNTGSAGGGGSSGVGGTVITQTGVTIPNLDPSFFFSAGLSHLNRPQTNTITSGGLTAVNLDNVAWNAGYQQQFLTGTSFSLGWNNSQVKTNNPFTDLNPNTSANVQLQFTQHLMQGFGLAVNNRNIRVAKNNLLVADLTFKLQVMTTVAAVVNLYSDLVSFNEDLRVKRKALEVAQKFYEDNKKQVQIGTLAPIEIVRAEANVAQAQQQLIASDASVVQQEQILKSALSRTGINSPSVAEARIVPTTALRFPVTDTLDSAKELLERAMKQRPDVEQVRINVENSKIQLAGSRSSLLPALDVQGLLQNNGLTGSVSTVPPPPGSSFVANPNAYFVGPYSNAMAQVFRRNFPDYTIGFQLSMPIRNRTAQADYIRDQLTVRQQQLGQQSLLNNIRVTITNSITAIESARAGYEAARKQRELQEQTLDAENKKYALGASTAFLVVQTQRDLATAQGGEVSALAAYARAKTQLDLATADLLNKYHIEMVEARQAKVARNSVLPPDARN